MPQRYGPILSKDDRNDPTTQFCPSLVVTGEESDRVVAFLVETFDGFGRKLGTVGTLQVTR